MGRNTERVFRFTWMIAVSTMVGSWTISPTQLGSLARTWKQLASSLILLEIKSKLSTGMENKLARKASITKKIMGTPTAITIKRITITVLTSTLYSMMNM